MTRIRSATETKVPLYLLPRTITGLLIKRGDAVYRISVKRTCCHHYNISVRTKPEPQAPATGTLVLCPVPESTPEATTDGTVRQDKECEA
jgi:hypothetical protein